MTAEPAKLPVISYARISDDGEADAHGVRDQHRVNRATANRLGWKVVFELTDNDRSASKADVVRESFETMLDAFKVGKLPNGVPVSGVVVVADDRLARRAGDYERFVEALTAVEGRVYADERGAKDLYSEDVEGLGLVGVAFSKIESRKVRRRLRRWHRARAEDGKPAGGTRPYGWRADNRNELEPVEAARLARAVDDVIAGRSINSIVREWQELGLPTSLGNAWSPRTLKLALNNPRLCGWRRLSGELVRGPDGQPISGTWQPIVSPEKWLAVNAIIDARRGKRVGQDGSVIGDLPADHREHKHLLTGTLRCGKPRPDGSTCGTRLVINHHAHCKSHLYVCPTKGNGGCGGVARRGDLVDEFITEAVLAKLEERHAMARPDQAEWEGEDELTRVDGKLSALRQQWTRDEISDGFFFATVRQLEHRARDLRNDQARHIAGQMRTRQGFTDVRERWFGGRLDMSQKRAYIHEALHAVMLLPAGRGRAPFNPDLLRPVWRE